MGQPPSAVETSGCPQPILTRALSILPHIANQSFPRVIEKQWPVARSNENSSQPKATAKRWTFRAALLLASAARPTPPCTHGNQTPVAPCKPRRHRRPLAPHQNHPRPASHPPPKSTPAPPRSTPASIPTPPPGPAPDGMVWIPGGKFSMGCEDPRNLPHGGPDAMPDARPIHSVFVDGFWMDRVEVTNRQFAAFVKATSYVTIAERTPTAAEFPGAPPENLVAGSVVFTPTRGEVAAR